MGTAPPESHAPMSQQALRSLGAGIVVGPALRELPHASSSPTVSRRHASVSPRPAAMLPFAKAIVSTGPLLSASGWSPGSTGLADVPTISWLTPLDTQDTSGTVADEVVPGAVRERATLAVGF